MNEISGDMSLFIWYVMSEPVIAAMATATVFVVLTVIASFFNFLTNK
jgi:hypothetical protein